MLLTGDTQKTKWRTLCVMAVVLMGLAPPALTQPAYTQIGPDNFGASGQLLRFFDTTSGAYPLSALTRDSAGNLYGTTSADGPNGYGTVFMLSPDISGNWKLTILHAFAAFGGDGKAPQGGVAFDSAGNLYGTTVFGGAHNYGSVYQLTPFSGGWRYSVLFSFDNHGSKGYYTYSTPALDAYGNIYGTTTQGGSGHGVIFQVAPQPDGSWKETDIYSFGGGDTASSYNVRLGPDGNLYGVSIAGGVNGSGSVFELSRDSDGSWQFHLLYTFGPSGGGDAYDPAGMTFDASGNIYGISDSGGKFGRGTLFELPHNLDGTWGPDVILHNFASNPGDGANPVGNPAFDDTGRLYGATAFGGSAGAGTLYQFSQSPNGSWSGKILHNFMGGDDGAEPGAGPIVDNLGNVYGTTVSGGMRSLGVAWEITP